MNNFETIDIETVIKIISPKRKILSPEIMIVGLNPSIEVTRTDAMNIMLIIIASYICHKET